ncbi:GNAT family N-acetyltransferase [Geobacter sp. SVR]|uniref:GNAT family N-acetyltransferase n=1 Tax=Geobacter sp. SVR TaxID=2495594 RepID=UPI00143F047D|nr:GNAT family protein [Geobacter sp. SVR]BCS52043.1 GNAT family N-acetyltransferase [Geobacter sp. SVR]GCF86498.1 GNAT family N-acetyltransferase [Geobacter sp. SVR]
MSLKPEWDIFPQLETDRLVLREIVPADAEELFRIFSDEETMQFWSCRPYRSVQQACELIASMAEAKGRRSAIHWGIARRGDNRLIGKCGYNEWRTMHRRGDVSYITARECWGRGIASEALSAVLDYGFHQMDLHSVEAGVTPGNDGSTRMLARLGFRLEGHLRESYWAEDRFVDSLIYSLLREDWRQRA